MNAKTFQTRIQLKKDTDANWRAADPVLLAGEVVYVETSSGEIRQKIGDGSKKYSQLAFMDEILRNQIPKKLSDLTNDKFEIANFTSGNTPSCDKTLAQLREAYLSGKILLATDGQYVYQLYDLWEATTGVNIQFYNSYGLAEDGQSVMIKRIDYYVDDSGNTVITFLNNQGISTEQITLVSSTGIMFPITAEEEILNLNDFKAIKNNKYTEPTADTYFVQKKYVDDKLAAAGSSANAVLYTEQTLTEAQKTQARANIGATSLEDVSNEIADTQKFFNATLATHTQIDEAFELGKFIYYTYSGTNLTAMAYSGRQRPITFGGINANNEYLTVVVNTDNSRTYNEQTVYELTTTAQLEPITGVVSASTLTNPAHITDLVQYDAFQAAVPMVQQLNITGAQAGQVPLIETVNDSGAPTKYSVMTPISQETADGAYLKLDGTSKMTGNIVMNNKEITQVAKISFLRGAYLQSSNLQQATVISALLPDGSPAYLSAYTKTPTADSNAMVLTNKEYVDTKCSAIETTQPKIYYVYLQDNGDDNYEVALKSGSTEFTTYNDLLAAKQNKMPIYCQINDTDVCFPLTPTDLASNGEEIKLEGFYNSRIFTIVFNNTAISDVTVEEVIKKSEIVSTLSASSTDTEVPSAKCVYEVLAKVNELLAKM